MTARQKEIETLRDLIGASVRFLKRTQAAYKTAIREYAEGLRDSVDSEQFRRDIDEGLALLERDKKRLAILEAQEASK